MQTDEEASEGVEKEKTKAVTFAAGTADELQSDSRPMTLYHDVIKKYGNVRLIKSKVCACLREGKYEDLSSLLKACAVEDLSAFCEKHGLSVFGLAIADREAAQLKCLVDNLPHEAVYHVFRRNNFSLLEGMLGGQRVGEEAGRSNFENKELLAEKLKIIFGMRCEDVNEFIRNNEDCKFMVGRGLRLMY